MLHSSGVTCVYIRPSFFSFGNSGGLCGLFNKDQSDDLFVWNYLSTGNGKTNSGYNKVTASVSTMSNFWK